MVYIEDGRVVEHRPWSLQRLSKIVWGFFDFVSQFFRTLIGLDRVQARSGRGGGGSGGNGPSGPGGGPAGPRNRGPRGMKDISSIQDCSMPGGG